MTTEQKTQRRKRTVRFHAVREGDELYHDRKWWQVKAHGIQPGDKFYGTHPKTGEKMEQIVPRFNPDFSCAVHVTRGRLGTVVEGPRTAIVTIIRER